MGPFYAPPQTAEEHQAAERVVSVETRELIARNSCANHDNIVLDDLDSLRGVPVRRAWGKTIVDLTSKAMRHPEHGCVALKAALIAAAKTLSVELAPYGVRVNSVAPGSIYEEGGDWDRQEASSPGTIASVAATIPMGRLGSPEEVARAVTFLLSPQSHWIVGHCLVVDGGQYPGVS